MPIDPFGEPFTPDIFFSHYFGEITDQQLDNYLKEFGNSSLGNDVVFDAAGKLVEIEGIIVETGSYSQSGTTVTISHDGSETINVGDVLNVILNVGAVASEVREELTVASVTSSTVFTVTRTTSATVSAEVVSFYKEDVPLAGTYSQ